MKKTFALLLALVMALALVACGQKEDNSGGETKDDQTQTDGQSVDLRAEYDAAIKDLEKAFSYDETNGDALYILGNAYKKKGDSKNAIKIYNQVIELFPNTEKARRAKDYLKELES